MNLKEYVAALNKILDKSPDLADLTVIYAEDNGFNTVNFVPDSIESIGHYEDREFSDSHEPNAICIN